jgi:hypothetical protein
MLDEEIPQNGSNDDAPAAIFGSVNGESSDEAAHED